MSPKPSLLKNRLSYGVIGFLLLWLFTRTLPLSFGQFNDGGIWKDSGKAADFDVLITNTGGTEISADTVLSAAFLDPEEEQTQTFIIKNLSEVDILCTPTVTNNLRIRVYVSGEIRESIIVPHNSSVSFEILFLAWDIQPGVTMIHLVFDIQQWDGRP